MNILINPNIAYLLVVTAVMLVITSHLFSPRSNLPKIGVLICLVGAGFELFNLQTNPLALVIVALSPLPYFMATRQAGPRRPLLVVSGLMLVFGSVFMLVDNDGLPVVNSGLLCIGSMACAYFIWVFTERHLNGHSVRRGSDPNSLVGLVGIATTLVEDVGLVKVEGEICPARSNHPIPAGSTVRILKVEGRILVVKKMEKLSKQ